MATKDRRRRRADAFTGALRGPTPEAPWRHLYGREVSPAEAAEAASNLLEFFRVAADWSVRARRNRETPSPQPDEAVLAERLS